MDAIDVKINNDMKIIIRTDTIFKQCFPPKILEKTHSLNFEDNDTVYSDIYFKTASSIYNKEQLIKAGFVNINRRILNPLSAVNYLTTPYGKIMNRIDDVHLKIGDIAFDKNDLYVLINTGCYDPIHDGHIELMEKAYEHFISNNKTVVGGYLIPSNTKYVSKKNGSDNDLMRLKNCQMAVKNHIWLSIDPFEILFEDDDVCFGHILERIEKYLQYHINKNIKVVYVFGGDRAEFARAFVNHGFAICVNRPGYETLYNKIKSETTASNNIMWCDTTTKNISSSSIRKLFKVEDVKSQETEKIYQTQQSQSDLLSEYHTFCKKMDDVYYRDFLLGHNLGGLVVKLPNRKLVRVPYVLPYVYPSERAASIPIENNVIFSIAIWNMNLEHYIETNELVEDVDMSTKKLLYYIGFTDKHSMAHVCRWHLVLFNM
jgi:nicotinic acid mononucleotide adenylyltransferase